MFRSIWYSIRRYVLPLLTSWKQSKSPRFIALQWIWAIRFRDLSLSDTYGYSSRIRHYVLFPPLSLSQIVHCKAKRLPLCQCCLQRVTLAYTQSSADFLRNDHAAKVINAAHDSCCFHISISLILIGCVCSLCRFWENMRRSFTAASRRCWRFFLILSFFRFTFRRKFAIMLLLIE